MAKKEPEEPEESSEEAVGEGEDTPKKSKKPLFLGGGIVGLIGLAFILAQMAVPKGSDKAPPFDGPFVIAVVEGDVQVNLAKGGGKHFLVLQFQAEYDAYDEAYAAARVVDPLYQAKLNDALIRLGRKKSKVDLDDQVGEEVFTAEIRDAVGPLIFPLHVGNEQSHRIAHEKSGLRPGRSAVRSTMRGGFKAHSLHVDAPNKTVRLDEGPVTSFQGTEADLIVEDARGQCIYLDVSELVPEFVGEIGVGTFGRVEKILFSRLLVQ